MSKAIPIIGGGIAGLTTALALAHRGQTSDVHEKAHAFEDVGAGIQLSPNAMGILRRLGLEEALRQSGVEPEGISLRDGRTGTELAAIPLGSNIRSQHPAPYLLIHRADLQKALVEACEKNDLVSIKTSSDITPEAFTDDAESSVVIAADGVHSKWRDQIRNENDKHFSGYVAWRSTIASEASDDPKRTRLWLSTGAHVVDYPVRNGTKRNVVVLAGATDPRPIRANPSTVLAEALNGWYAPLRSRLVDHDDWTPWPLFTVDPHGPWSNDRVALVGDAAHAMLPFLAQGAAMAIEDAWVLAQMLTNAAQPYQGLQRYEMARKTRVTRVWNEAAQNGRTYHLGFPFALARNAVLKALSGEQLLARYDWLYRWQGTGT